MTAIANHPHRVSSAVAGVRSTLASVAGVPLWSMDPTETTATLDEVQAAKAQLAELEARLLAHADRIEVAAATAATSTANWHAHPPAPPGPRRTGRCGSPRASRTTT